MSRVPYEKIKAECRQMVQAFQKDPENYRFIIPDNQWNFYYHCCLSEELAVYLNAEELDLALSQIKIREPSYLVDYVMRFRNVKYVKVLYEHGCMNSSSHLEELLLADGSWIQFAPSKCSHPGRPDHIRIEMCRYLLDHREGIRFDADKLYFLALLEGDLVLAAELQERIGNLDKYFDQLAKAEGYAWDRFNDYLFSHGSIHQEICLQSVARRFRRNGDISVPDSFDLIQSEPNTFLLEVILKSPVKPAVERKVLFEQLIWNGKQALLDLAAEKGWLGDTASLNLFVETARKQKAYQIEAWAMDDFRQRYDDAEVRRHQEEEMLEQLMEDPYSPEALKREWEFECYEDHAVITRYKGSQTEVVVPCRVGDLPVTILQGTFYYLNTSNKYQEAKLEKILRVTVPEGVEKIKRNTFCGLSSCIRIRLPHSLKVIEGDDPFSLCYVLSEIVIPPAVKWISEDAVRYKYRRSVTFEGNTEIIRQEDDDRFNYSYDLVIIAKKGSPAEEYAVQNHFRFQELLPPE